MLLVMTTKILWIKFNLLGVLKCVYWINIVDCKWSEYGEWSECSVTCGNGKHISTRKVIQQALNGGLECEGEDTKTKPCKLKKCKG